MRLWSLFLYVVIIFSIGASFAQYSSSGPDVKIIEPSPLAIINQNQKTCPEDCHLLSDGSCYCTYDLFHLKDAQHNPEGDNSKEKTNSETTHNPEQKGTSASFQSSAEGDNWLGTGSTSFTSEGKTTALGGLMPSTKYQDTYPLTTYQGTYRSAGNNHLWIEDSQGLIQYASVPQYSQVSLVASTSTGGQGEVYELYPTATSQGTYNINIYSFMPGYNRMGFNADAAGRHILFFTVNNQPSDAVIVDVSSGQFSRY
jgi:hypothetical protein